MPAEPVTAGQYPELSEHDLISEQGDRIRFLGRIVKNDAVCGTCGRTDATVYRGPQHGLAHDIPVDGGFTVAPVELEMTWCPTCGHTGIRLVDPEGNTHTGW